MKKKMFFVSILISFHYAQAGEVEVSASLNGTLGVDSFGTLKYSLPISIFPSINDFSPQLSIDYNGQNPDGVLGIGWGISGISSISRCFIPQKKINDAQNSTTKIIYGIEETKNIELLNYTQNKQIFSASNFCLDGVRLIRVSSDNVSPSLTEFRLENDEFTKIKIDTESSSQNQSQIDIKKFISIDRNGVEKEYSAKVFLNYKNKENGNYEINNSKPFLDYVWGLTKVKDLNGNYWTVDYLDPISTGILYPKSIMYTKNLNAPDSLNDFNANQIEFEYEQRAENEKKLSFIESGSAIILDKKIKRILLKKNKVSISEYNFDYEEISDNVANKTRLKKITQCYFDMNNIRYNKFCLSPHSIGWTSNGKNSLNSAINTNIVKFPVISSSNEIKYITMNTDKGSRFQKRLPLIKKGAEINIYDNFLMSDEKETIKLSHSLFGQFKEWHPFLMDVNNDEISDIIIYGKDYNNNVSLIEFVSTFNEKGRRKFNFYKELLNIFNTSIGLKNILPKDIDGDGIQDIVLNHIDSNGFRYDTLKMNNLGDKISLYTKNMSNSSIQSIKNNNGNHAVDKNMLFGKFNQYSESTSLFYYFSSSGLNFCSFKTYENLTSSDQISCYSNTTLIPSPDSENYKNYDFSVVDYNGDGLDDIVLSKIVKFDNDSKTATRFNEKILVLLSKGSVGDRPTFELLPIIETKPVTLDISDWNNSWENYWSTPFFADYDQDGKVDYYRYTKGEKPYLIGYLQNINKNFDSYINSLADWDKAKTENQRIFLAVLGLPSGISSSDYYIDISPDPYIDSNLDGYPDLGLTFLAIPKYPNSGNSSYLYTYSAQAKKNNDYFVFYGIENPEVQDLLASVDNGRGIKSQINYSNKIQLTDSIDKKPFPIRTLEGPILTVNSINNFSNGNIFSSTNYDFRLPRIDIKENRYLGFEVKKETSSSVTKDINGNHIANKLETETVYKQDYPFIGMPKSIITKANNKLVSRVLNNDIDFVSDSPYPNVKFPRIKGSTTENYELGTLVSITRRDQTQETTFGNIVESNQVVSNPNGSEIFSTNLKMSYYPHDLVNWRIGKVKQNLVTSNRTGRETIQNKSVYEYNDKNLLIKQINEPDDVNLRIENNYAYNLYGNLISTKTIDARNSSDATIGNRGAIYEYDAGIFKTKQTNILGHEEKFYYSSTTGKLIGYIDPNGLTGSYNVDYLGRVVGKTFADKSVSTTSYDVCKSFKDIGSNSLDCEIGEIDKITTVNLGEAPLFVFKDAFGNITRTLTQAYDNINYIVTRNEYNPSGKLFRTSEPALSNVGYSNLKWTTFEYDVLGRIVKTVQPGNRVASVEIAGLTNTQINAKGQKRKEISNIANEVVEIIDHDNNSLKYTFDALGRLIKTSDALNRSITLTLDKNGNKLQQVDPILGTWNYRYNVLGQPVWQKDGKGQETIFQYDGLGRLVKRIEPDLISEWTWDNARYGKGKLAKLSSTNGFVQDYEYDHLGRLIRTTIGKQIDPKAQSNDENFVSTTKYDKAGRVLAYAYPTGFGYRNIYDTNGYLREVRSLDSKNLIWGAVSRDAKGNVTEQTLGNGLVTKKTFKSDTGFIESINTDDARVQQNTYSFDVLGNLINRNQNSAGISNNEAFTYDNINRLKTVVNQSGLTSSVSYDAIGNIIQKNDIEISNPAKPVSYSWTSFNMPLQIKQDNDSESFMYGPTHERVRRTSIEKGKTSTTIYINPRIDTGGTFEKTYLPDGTFTNTHYIYANGDVIGSYITKDKGVAPRGDLGSVNEEGVVPNNPFASIVKTGPYLYFHKDILNSIEAITDASGNIVERLSYNPWGKRRNADGSVSQTALKGLKSNHGFTSHEMLDNIGLVHMNGRLYDPVIGRFISADPTIDGADDLQGYNRYAYVHNNPISLIDPDGYGWTKFWKKVGNEFKNGLNIVLDDWLGTCSKSKGDCGVSVGITYGPDSQGLNNQNNDGTNKIRANIGFGGGPNSNDYRFSFLYGSEGFYFDRFYYPQKYQSLWGGNYIDIGLLRDVFNTPIVINHEDLIFHFDDPSIMHAKAKVSQQESKQFIDSINNELTAFNSTMSFGLFADMPQSGGYFGQSIGMAAGMFTGSSEFSVLKNFIGSNKLINLFKSNPCGCFDDDTPVLTKDGAKRIVEIKEGELVLARNEETGEIAYKPVKRIFVVPNRRIYLLKTIDNKGKENTIEVSDDHPFWIIGKKWVESIDLQEGDQLLDANNKIHEVVSLSETDRIETTYNLEVEGYHTYFAGDANIWVHNSNCIFGSTKLATEAAEKLGYSRVKSFPFNSHGQAVYKKGNQYITPEVAPAHNGGTWKIFNQKGKRIGTADAELNIFKK